MDSAESLRMNRATWVEDAIKGNKVFKEEKWTKSLAVGGLEFTEDFVGSLGMKGQNRVIKLVDDACIVKEPSVAYSPLFGAKKGSLSE